MTDQVAAIEVLNGEESGLYLPIEVRRFSIGRLPENDLVLTSKFISRRHARITRKKGQYYIEGLSPKNPLRIGSEVLEGKQKLEGGEKIRICDIKLRFHLEERQPSRTRRSRSKKKGRRDPISANAETAEAFPGRFDDPADEEEDATAGLVWDEMSAMEPEEPSSDDGGMVWDELSGHQPEADGGGDGLMWDEESAIEKGGAAAHDSEASGVGVEPVGAGVVWDEEPGRSASRANEVGPDGEERTSFVDMDMLVRLREGEPEKEQGKAGAKGLGELNEKTVRLLIGVAGGGVLLAACVVLYFALTGQSDVIVETERRLYEGQYIRYNVPWLDGRYPVTAVTLGEGSHPETAEAMTLAEARAEGFRRMELNDRVAEVSWILPTYHERAQATFVIGGLREGSTAVIFHLENGDRMQLPITVEGPSPEQRGDEAFVAEVVALSDPEDQLDLIEGALLKGEAFWERRTDSGPGLKRYLQAIEELRHAQLGLQAIRGAIGPRLDVRFNDLRNRTDALLQEAKKAHEALAESWDQEIKDRYNAKDQQGAKRVLSSLLLLLPPGGPEYLEWQIKREVYFDQ